VHLASSPTLAKLEYLSLGNNAITERGVRALHAAKPARLNQLHIGDNRIDDEAAFELAKWDELLYVDVDGNPIGKRAEAAIAKRPVRCCP
jgi:Leucine Rich repeat